MVCSGAQTSEQVDWQTHQTLSQTDLSQQGLLSSISHQELENLDAALCPALYPVSRLPRGPLGSPVGGVLMCYGEAIRQDQQ